VNGHGDKLVLASVGWTVPALASVG
jgi:hypothetical protein